MTSQTAQLDALSAEEKRRLLKSLLRKKVAQAAVSFPLSVGQRVLWLAHECSPDDPSYHLVGKFTLEIPIDEAVMRRVVRQLVQRHPLLRVRFSLENGVPRQTIGPFDELSLDVLDASTLSEEQIQSTIDRETDRPFDLALGPLLRVLLLRISPRRQVIVMTIHHIIADFVSVAVLLRDIAELYLDEHLSATAPTAEQRASYADFVRWQNTVLEGEEGQRLQSFWIEELQDAPLRSVFPHDRERPTQGTIEGAAHWFEIETPLVEQLRALATGHNATLYMLVVAAFKTLLHRYTGQEDIVIGSPMRGHTRTEFQGVVGYFSNLVALRLRTAPTDTFVDMLNRVRDTVFKAIEHQHYPLAGHDGATVLPFQMIVAWEKMGLIDLDALIAEAGSQHTQIVRKTFDSMHVEQRGAPFDVMLQVFETTDSLRVCLRYDNRMYEAGTIERLSQHFYVLLSAIVADPHCQIANVLLLTPEELRQQLVEWNDTSRPYSLDVCLHQLVEAQVARSPDAPAVTFDNRSLSYTELNTWADRVANVLRSHGIRSDSIVAVVMERSLELMPTVLGILKAGAAYLPLDPFDPTDRLHAMLADASARVVLTQRRFAETIATDGVTTLVMDEESASTISLPTNSSSSATSHNLAYVIYTSGSTGKPKGVMIEHRGIVNRLLWMQDTYRLTADDCVLHKTPLTFDVSVWELFWPLISGARLVVARPGGHREPDYLVRLIADEHVTTVHFVPTLLRAFVEQPGVETLSSLRRVIASGEALSPELVARFNERSSAELHNLYGPTEASIDVTAFACPRSKDVKLVPIGRPIANTQTYILDRNLQPLPVGLPGELYLGGVQLARGYLNQPELTAERFVAHPFSASAEAKLFRTGDLARYLPDGNLEFLGRIDHQIKLSGYRIELGEIETVLGRHVLVREAVVATRGEGVNQHLVAYILPTESPGPTAQELRDFAAKHLPAYMVPATIVAMQSFPLTASGKVDRAKLPSPLRTRGELGTPYAAPRTLTERTLVAALEETLTLDRVGIHDNFFELGGASNQALELIAKVNAAGVPLTAELIFKHPTVAQLAAACDRLLTLQGNTVVESLGVYLPPRVVSTEEVMRGCVRKLDFPLEELTGIRRRHMAGETEFSFDLAVKATEECFARSRHTPEDIDLVICCNISRLDGPSPRFSFEPSTAIRLCAQFQMRDAIAFDVSNACAGMFTGISLADTLLRLGLVDRALIVSGEYISHLTDTAQVEIQDDFDPRLPCLTVGDAGAAILLERTADKSIGLHEIDLCTHSQYSRHCIAKAGPYGAIMLTDVLGVSSVVTQEGVAHWAKIAKSHGWKLDDVRHLIPHQVSQTTVANGFNEARKLGDLRGREEMVICNVAERANTASTSHWVALWDHSRTGRINSGDNIVFGVSGSGITIGTALYTLDDLPARLRGKPHKPAGPLREPRSRTLDRASGAIKPRIAVTGVGTSFLAAGEAPLSLELARRAAESCFADARFAPADLELLIYAGIYREDFLSEPALATLLAGDLRIGTPSGAADLANLVASPNGNGKAGQAKSFFAFDLVNGSIGPLQACYFAIQRIRSGKIRSAMVAAAEIDNNAPFTHEPPLGISEAGSALLLQSSANGRTGFGNFVFHNRVEHINKRQAYVVPHDGRGWMRLDQDPDLEELYLETIEKATNELLQLEGLRREDVRFVLPPQISPTFAAAVNNRLTMPNAKMVSTTSDGGDPFSSSLAFSLAQVRHSQRALPGEAGIVIGVGAGIQVGCCVYYF